MSVSYAYILKLLHTLHYQLLRLTTAQFLSYYFIYLLQADTEKSALVFGYPDNISTPRTYPAHMYAFCDNKSALRFCVNFPFYIIQH